jgi:hypothetical protein
VGGHGAPGTDRRVRRDLERNRTTILGCSDQTSEPAFRVDPLARCIHLVETSPSRRDAFAAVSRRCAQRLAVALAVWEAQKGPGIRPAGR